MVKSACRKLHIVPKFSVKIAQYVLSFIHADVQHLANVANWFSGCYLVKGESRTSKIRLKLQVVTQTNLLTSGPLLATL